MPGDRTPSIYLPIFYQNFDNFISQTIFDVTLCPRTCSRFVDSDVPGDPKPCPHVVFGKITDRLGYRGLGIPVTFAHDQVCHLWDRHPLRPLTSVDSAFHTSKHKVITRRLSVKIWLHLYPRSRSNLLSFPECLLSLNLRPRLLSVFRPCSAHT